MCHNPNLIRVLHLLPNQLDMIPNLKKNKWNVNVDTATAYKFIPSSSRNLPLEEIPEYISQDIIEVGCGGCIDCRLQYSKDWANRCYLESLLYSNNYFITLTYNDDSIVLGETGNPTIVKEHIHTFLNTLRQKFKRELNHVGVRYFGCAEYGDLTFRPHYHIVLFNCPIPDLTPDFKDDNGQITHHFNKMDNQPYLWSQFVKDCWSHGNILIADCNFNTSQYVSRYVLKKQKGHDGKVFYDKLSIEPPYLYMSNRPGIGKEYLDLFQDKIKDDPHIYAPRVNKETLISGLPRYFVKKLREGDESWYDSRIDIAKSNIDARRSLIAGKDTINHQRSIAEYRSDKLFNKFTRDFD